MASVSKKTIVLKIGSSSLLDEEGVKLSSLSRFLETCKRLRKAGHDVIIVTSGAVGMGMTKTGFSKKPELVAAKQALAAIGQIHLMRTYTDMMNSLGMVGAQILLTIDVMLNRPGLKNTVVELLKLDTVPIFNENDAVNISKAKFGDNDQLAAHVAGIVGADICVLFTDVDALYTGNPNTDPSAVPIREVHDISALRVDVSSGTGSAVGTGGMATKIKAARIATRQGVTLVIANAQAPDTIERILEGERLGTVFHPNRAMLARMRKTYAPAAIARRLPFGKPVGAFKSYTNLESPAMERRRRCRSSPMIDLKDPYAMPKMAAGAGMLLARENSAGSPYTGRAAMNGHAAGAAAAPPGHGSAGRRRSLGMAIRAANGGAGSVAVPPGPLGSPSSLGAKDPLRLAILKEEAEGMLSESEDAMLLPTAQ